MAKIKFEFFFGCVGVYSRNLNIWTKEQQVSSCSYLTKIIFIEVALQMYQDFFSEGIITAQNIY